MSAATIKKALEQESFVGALMNLTWTMMENGVFMDRVNGLLKLKDLADVPFDKGQMDIIYSFIVKENTLVLSRQWACTVCSDDDHNVSDCLVHLKIFSQDKGWIYCAVEVNLEQSKGQMEGTVEGKEVAMVVESIEGSVPVMTTLKVTETRVGKKKSRKKPLKKKNVEESEPPAKKAKN